MSFVYLNLAALTLVLMPAMKPLLAQPQRVTLIAQQLKCEVIENNNNRPQVARDRSNLLKRVNLTTDQLDWFDPKVGIKESYFYLYQYFIPNYFADPLKDQLPVSIKLQAVRKSPFRLHLQMTEITLGDLKSDTFYASSAPTSRLEVSVRRYGSDRIAVKCELTEINQP